jgi:hypothetical protein
MEASLDHQGTQRRISGSDSAQMSFGGTLKTLRIIRYPIDKCKSKVNGSGWVCRNLVKVNIFDCSERSFPIWGFPDRFNPLEGQHGCSGKKAKFNSFLQKDVLDGVSVLRIVPHGIERNQNVWLAACILDRMGNPGGND